MDLKYRERTVLIKINDPQAYFSMKKPYTKNDGFSMAQGPNVNPKQQTLNLKRFAGDNNRNQINRK